MDVFQTNTVKQSTLAQLLDYYTNTGMTDEAEALNQRLYEKKKVLSNSTSSKRSLVNTQSVSPHTNRRVVNDQSNSAHREGE